MCTPPEMQVKHTEPTKTKSRPGELRGTKTLVQSLLKSTESMTCLSSVWITVLFRCVVLHAGKVDNTAEPPKSIQKDLCPFAATQIFSSLSACLHLCLLSWACKHLPTSLPIEKNLRKSFNGKPSWGKRQVSSSPGQTECSWSHWKQQEGNNKSWLGSFNTSSSFGTKELAIVRCQIFLAH